ncbi:MAG: hypothetical protein HY580_03375 [Nitrospinae bacterium]|nr:hypothetical protein [Nitrospinota bacterium]
MVERSGLGNANDRLLRTVENNRSGTAASLAKIATGNRLTGAGEDPTASSISAQLRSEVQALSQAVRNTEAGANFVNTAEGGLATISSLVARGRELAVQAANGTLGDAQRQSLNQEFTAIRGEIDRIVNSLEFNGQPLLNGNLGADSPNQVNIQVGTESGPENQINLNVIENAGTQALGIATADISTAEGALQAFDTLGDAAGQINAARGRVGAASARLSVAVNALGPQIENLSAAENQLAGTDIAREVSNLQLSQLRTQASLQALAAQNRQNLQIPGRLLDIQG